MWVVTCLKLETKERGKLVTRSLLHAVGQFLKWYFYDLNLDVRLARRRPVSLSNQEFYDGIYAKEPKVWHDKSVGWVGSTPGTSDQDREAMRQKIAALNSENQ